MDENLIKELLKDAHNISSKAYAPYSNFPVGCVVVLNNGEKFFGVNIENASYPVCICAERSAMARVVTEGRHREISVVVVVTAAQNPGSPCGMCRQFLSEFLEPHTPIIFGTQHGDYVKSSMSELLPYAFSKAELESSRNSRR